MSGGPKVRSMNIEEKSISPKPKPASKQPKKVEDDKKRTKEENLPVLDDSSTTLVSSLKRQEMLQHLNCPLSASCSSDASSDSFCSRASTGRIGRVRLNDKSREKVPKPETTVSKIEEVVSDAEVNGRADLLERKRRCSWVTPNTDPRYVAFHDKEWGVPVHDDRKLFELLVLSGALAELTWPSILGKRHIFREAFMEFDPSAVSRLNEKKMVAPGSTTSLLLSEPKLRAIVDNARQILKIIDEFRSFDNYVWGFVNRKPIMSRFRYPREVPMKTPKADVISKDLVRRGFRSVGPTVIYTFMQAAGLTNDHLIGCYRCSECAALAEAGAKDNNCSALPRAVDGLTPSSS